MPLPTPPLPRKHRARAARMATGLPPHRRRAGLQLLLQGLLLATAGLLALQHPPAQARGLTELAREAAAEGGLTDRLIVKYRSDNGNTRRSLLSAGHPTQQGLQAFGLQALDSHRNALGAQVLQLDRWTSEQALREVARTLMQIDANVLYAEPDTRLQAQAVPNDPLYAQQWHYHEAGAGLNLPAAWDLSTGSGVVMAVVDSGVRPHADLAAHLLPGADMISNPSTANDGDGRDADASDPGDACGSGSASWHGTHVAGTMAAVSNNGLGGAGVAWDGLLLPVRALGCGGGYSSDIADGIVWAAGGTVAGLAAPAQPARVINLSLGSQGSCTTTLQAALSEARARGATIVVAAGNANLPTAKFTPANCKGVITVAALGRNGARAPYSNYGAEVDVAAPGGNMNTGTANGVLSTLNTGQLSPDSDSYDFLQGTSMASPHVAGVVALMLGRNPALTPDEIEVLLKGSTRKIPGACTSCGTGLVNAGAAVSAVYLGSRVPTAVAEQEPNDSHAQAQGLADLPAKLSGSMASGKDLDTYRVSVPPGATLRTRLIANVDSDYSLALRSVKGTVIATSAKGKGLADGLNWTNKTSASADIFVRVSRVSGGVGESAGRYTLELSR